MINAKELTFTAPAKEAPVARERNKQWRHDFKVAFLDTLLASWDKDMPMTNVAIRVLESIGERPNTAIEVPQWDFDLFHTVIPHRWKAGMTSRAFIALHYPKLSEALWDKRSSEMCRRIGRRHLGLCGGGRCKTIIVKARDLTKKHDWKTVK